MKRIFPHSLTRISASIQETLVLSICIFWIFFLGLLPLFWFEDGKILAGGEIATFANLSGSVEHLFSTWNDRFSGPNLEISQLVTYWPWIAATSLGFSNEIGLKLVWLLPFLIKPWCFSFLVFCFFGFKIRYLIPATIGATFIVLNPFELVNSLGLNRHYFICAATLILGAYHRINMSTGFSEKMFWMSLLAISSLLLSPAAGNPALAGGLMALLLVQLLAYRIKTPSNITWDLATLFSCLLVNSYWLLLTLDYFLMANQGLSQLETKTSVNILNWNSFHEGQLSESIRQLGSWAFKNDTYFPFYDRYYDNVLVVFFSYLPFTFVLLNYFMVKDTKHRKTYLTLLLGLLFTLFLAKGTNAPLGSLTSSLITSSEYLMIFRSPWVKFLDASIIVIAINLSLTTILGQHKWREHKNFTITFSSIYLIVIAGLIYVSLPLFSQQAVRPAGGFFKEPQIVFPEYWEEYNEWSSQIYKHGNGERALLYPETGFVKWDIYKWDNGAAASQPLATYSSPMPLIFHMSDDAIASQFNQATNKLYDLLVSPAGENANEILRHMNALDISRVIFFDDIDYAFQHENDDFFYPTKMILRRLRAEKKLLSLGFEIEQVFGNKIFVYKNIRHIGGNNIVMLDPKPAIQIPLEKVSSNKYRITSVPLGHEFLISISQRLSKNWKASVFLEGCDGSKSNLQKTDHPYGMNLWSLDSTAFIKRFPSCGAKYASINISYQPFFEQKYLMTVSIISSLIALCYSLVFGAFVFHQYRKTDRCTEN